MPWGVAKRDGRGCPVSRPWAVLRLAGSYGPEKIVACHVTKESALRQQRALYANTPEGRAAAYKPGEEPVMPEQFIVPLEQKAVTGSASDPGEISGLASFYGNVDLQDDVMERGAADRSISHQKTARTKLPLLDWHGDSLARLIGSVKELKSVPQGVWFNAGFSRTPEAQRARQLAQEGHLNGVSIGYLPVRASVRNVDGKSVRVLHEVKLLEVSLTPVPANPLAQVASVKAADSSKPYGDVAYADPGYQSDGQKRYPLDTEAHCRAAWSYINMPKNAAMYTADQLAAIKARIRAALKKYGVQVSESSLEFSQFADSMRAALDITFEPARKAAVDLLVGGYQFIAPGPADEPEPTADAPAPDEGTAETKDAAAYAASFLTPPGPRDDAPAGEPPDALAYPQKLLESIRDDAAFDALETQINQALGRAAT